MLEINRPSQETEGIPFARNLGSLATSGGLVSSNTNELRVPLTRAEHLSRRATLTSLYSEDPCANGISDQTETMMAEGLIAPQLEEAKQRPLRPGKVASAALLLMGAGRIPACLELLDSVAAETEDYWVHHYRAMALFRIEKVAEAEDLFSVLAKKNAGDIRPLHGLGRIYLAQQKWDAAWGVLQEASQVRKAPAEVFNDLGAAALGRADTQTAIRCFRRSLKKNPRLTIALNNIGLCFLIHKDKRRAMSMFLQALRTDTHCVAALHNVSECLIEEKRFAEAADLLEEHVKRAPSDIQAQERLAWAQFKLGRAVQAEKRIEKVLAAVGNRSASLLNNIGLIYDASGKWNKVVTSFRRAIELEPDNLLVRKNYALLLERRERWEEIVEVLPEEIAKTDPDALLCLVNALVYAGRPEETVQLLNDGIVDHPAFQAPMLCSLGFVLTSRLGRLREGIAAYRKAHAQAPEVPIAANNLAYALIRSGEIDEARRILKRWFHYSDNHRDNVALCIRASRGLLLMREGRYGEGLQCYREAKAGANGILRRRLEQKILIEMARNDSACGHQDRAAKRLREAISSNADAEFTKEARDLLAGGCALN